MSTRLNRLARWLAILAMTALASGCATLGPRFEAPKVSVTDVRVEELSRSDQRFRVRVHVANPNAVALPIRSLSCGLRLDRDDVGRGESSESFTVPGHGEADFMVRIRTDLFASVLRIASKMREGGSPPEYQAKCVIATELPFLKTIPVEAKGSLFR
jgi:LEA14-like dessication related protein